MARNAQEHDSATSQFFINVKDNPSLDYGGSIYSDWGYTVFGRVIEGMDVVNKIRKLKTGSSANFKRHVPKSPVIIEKVFVENAPSLIYDAPVSAEPTAEKEESHSTARLKIQGEVSLTESAEPEIQNETQAETSLTKPEIQVETPLAEPEIQSEIQSETLLAEPEIQAKISLNEVQAKTSLTKPEIQSETLLVEPETQVETPLAEYDLAEPEARAETSLAEAKVSLQKNPEKVPEKVVVQTPTGSSPKIFLLAPDPPSVSDKQEPLAD
jgi:hypothetical protein